MHDVEKFPSAGRDFQFTYHSYYIGSVINIAGIFIKIPVCGPRKNLESSEILINANIAILQCSYRVCFFKS